MSNTHRDARLLGYHREKELLIDLHQSYPGEIFRLGYKEIFDLYGPVLIDHVGIDSQHRLIIDKKHGCHAHIQEANSLNRIGYISFCLDGCYYFLPIESIYARYHKRPVVTPMLLRSCCMDPLHPDEKSKPIISSEYVNRLNLASSLKQQQNMPKYASIKPSKPAYLLQADIQRRLYERACLTAGR